MTPLPPGRDSTHSGISPVLERDNAMPNVIEIDRALLDQARQFRQRAESLRSQAASLSPVLGTAYRRRASELEFEAWVSELQSGIPYDQVHPAV
jgi:hypothetical protein